ncbi:hypothetical protein OE88DRAFT_1660294 [Heliocybe sulcata]|uniref:Uncharacterized protein n=1 Tax=Heliocybe sulcata TaxID=5364 RepID=A0A5C3N0C6_9AGAM|nr:hypothetical protein OE88DRAFT_1660294 [Heliocybe sulcata]
MSLQSPPMQITMQRYFMVAFTLLTSILLQAGVISWTKLRQNSDATELRSEEAANSIAWAIPEPGIVAMSFEETIHYQLEGPDADAEWHALYPGNGAINLGSGHEPFSLTMFHQLRCLDIVRIDLMRISNSKESLQPSRLARHCFNYLRQMSHCHADKHIDPLATEVGSTLPNIHICRDWSSVYTEVGKIQQRDIRWRSNQVRDPYFPSESSPDAVHRLWKMSGSRCYA